MLSRYDPRMSTMPPAHPGSPVPPPWQPATGAAPKRRPRLAMIMMLAVGLAIGVAGGAGIIYLYNLKATTSAPTSTFSEQQISQAKGQVCSVYEDVHKEISTNSARDQGSDPVQQLAVTATIRQAFLAGSAYLLTTLSEQPATPPELAKPVRQLAIAYQEVTIGYLNGKTNSDLESTLRNGDEAAQAIQGLCS